MGLISKKKKLSFDSDQNDTNHKHHHHNHSHSFSSANSPSSSVKDKSKQSNRLSFHQLFNKDNQKHPIDTKSETISTSVNNHPMEQYEGKQIEPVNNTNTTNGVVDPEISIDLAKNPEPNNGLLNVHYNGVGNDSKSSTTSSINNKKQPQELNPEAIQQNAHDNSSTTQNSETGFLTNLFITAANKISSSQQGPAPKDKDHNSFAHKLDNLIRTVRHEDSRTSLNDINNNSNGNTDQQPRNSQDLKSLHSAHDVQFESIRESPLNTLGNGDLSLNDFENTTATSQTMMSQQPSIRSNDRLETYSAKRTLSPDIIQKQIPIGNQLQATSNGMDVKRVHRRSFNGSSHQDRGSSIGRNSQFETSTVLSEDGKNHGQNSTKSEVKSNSTMNEDELSLHSDSENENLDQIIDYSKKIKHASKKENNEFHQTFKKLPKNEKLIDDFSCAYSKDILVHGKMYLSDHYICFNSNILGWVTNILIPLQEVIQIEKKSTAVLFPNGMIIRTLHQKYVFATFISRDTTFDLITNVWHRVLLENSDIDPSRLQQAAAAARRKRANSKNSMQSSDGDYAEDDEEDEYDDEENSLDEEDDYTDNESKESEEEDNQDQDQEKDQNDSGGEKKDQGDTFNGFAITGPKTHSPTTTDYEKDSGETVVAEDNIKAPPGVVYNIMFGSDTSNFIRILKDQKNFDISEDDIKGLNEKMKKRNYTYTKPLGGSIGPKQTKCVIEDKLIEHQPEKFYEIQQVTQTPDVPSGNSFKVDTKIFLSWGEKNSTKIWVVTSIEWSGKSWIKGAIEKGTIDGQKDSMKTMIETINTLLEQGNGKKSSTKRKPTRSRRNTEKKDDTKQQQTEEKQESKDILGQLIGLINSIGDMIPIPMLSNTITGSIILILGFFISLFIFSKLFQGGSHQNNIYEIIPNNKYTSRIRIKNDEFLVIPSIDTNLNNQRKIRQEEVSLWSWLKERSEGKLNLEFTGNLGEEFDGLDDEELKQKYSQQELKEIVRLTRIKLDKLSERLENC